MIPAPALNPPGGSALIPYQLQNYGIPGSLFPPFPGTNSSPGFTSQDSLRYHYRVRPWKNGFHKQISKCHPVFIQKRDPDASKAPGAREVNVLTLPLLNFYLASAALIGKMSIPDDVMENFAFAGIATTEPSEALGAFNIMCNVVIGGVDSMYNIFGGPVTPGQRVYFRVRYYENSTKDTKLTFSMTTSDDVYTTPSEVTIPQGKSYVQVEPITADEILTKVDDGEINRNDRFMRIGTVLTGVDVETEQYAVQYSEMNRSIEHINSCTKLRICINT